MGRVSDARERLLEAVTELVWTGSYGSTTIDAICERAGVKKGSFYYFFKSKSELAVAALKSVGEKRREELDRVFSPIVPPLERLKRFVEDGCCMQRELKQKYGFVLGCPLYTLGSEISTQETELRAVIEDHLSGMHRYLESAIRDAHNEGLIHAPDASTTAKLLMAFYEGLVTQARISNDLSVLNNFWPGTLNVLGIREPVLTAA